MGLSIGQAPALLGAQGIRNVRSASFFDSGARDRTRLPGQDEPNSRPALFGQRDPEPPRVGLGPGTLSGPAAALNTLQNTVREIRATQPTIREINIGFQRDAAQERAFIREQRQQEFRNEGRNIETSALGEPRGGRNRIQFRLPEPAAQARNFINSLNDAAGAAQARFSDNEPAAQSGPSFQVNGQRVAINNRPGSIINLTA